MSLEVIELTKKYGNQLAVNNISFSAQKGKILGFLGPNGAGKSTTMKISTGFVMPTSGRVIVAGLDITTDSLEARKKIGYLPEHNPLYLDLYVKESLQLVAGMHKLSNVKSRVAEMVELCGLEVEQHKKIGELSKGYRQRVGLAQAFIHDPEILILDEPTTGLDPNQILQIRALIKNISAEKTVIFSTHILQEVQALCDEVVIINRGEVVAFDKTENLTKRAGNILKIQFAGTVSSTALMAIDGVGKVLDEGQNRFELHCDNDLELVRKAIFAQAAEENWDLVELVKVENSLEDVFHHLTN